MTARLRHLAAAYLLMVVLLTSITPSSQQQAQAPPSPDQLQTMLFLKDLMKANPDLTNLIKYVDGLPDNTSTGILQGVTLSPFYRVGLSILENLGAAAAAGQNSSVASTTPSPSGGVGGAGNVTTPSAPPPRPDPAQLLQAIMQNPQYSSMLQTAIAQVTSGLQKARADNVDVTSNLTALLGYIDPVTLAREALVPVLAASQYPDNTNLVSRECYNDVIDSLKGLVEGQSWAIQMFDALGKPNAGIMRGSLYFVGSYDECVNTKPHVTRQELLVDTSRDFGTRHCRADIKIPEAITNALNVDTHGVGLKLIWGMCVPSSCHEHDVKGLFQLGAVKQLNIDITDVKCHRDLDLATDKSAMAAVIIFSFFGFLVLVGTLIDGCRACSTDTSGDVEMKPALTTDPGKTAPPKVTTATNGTTTEQKKETETTAPANVTDVKVDLPPAYMPHREGPHKPYYSVKPVMVEHTNGNAGAELQRETPRVPPKNRTDPVLVRVFLCFSIYTNVPRLLQARQSPGTISCVHGIRLFSITWVMLGHTYNYGLVSFEGTYTADNMLEFEGYWQRFSYQAVMAAGYAVDTFFMLSAFLLAWIQLKEADKRKHKLDLNTGIMYYFHRFWRLTPIYMFVMMGYTCLVEYLGSGPFWANNIHAAAVCRDTWWTNLLYVNNLVKTDTQCMGWSWYLANDMQFYVISPIFIIAMYMWAVPGALFTSLLLCMGISIAFWKEHIYNGEFLTMFSDGGEYWTNVYTVPWCRVSPWAIGLLLGLIIYKRGKRPLRNKKLYALGWLVSTAVALFLVYITYNKHKKDGETWTNVQNAAFESFGRAGWAACVAWVVFACHTGKGGVVNSILSWNGLIPLSRLSYAAYLLHPIVYQVYMFSRKQLFHASDYSIIYLYLGHTCMTFMVAFVFSLVFEAPFMALEKVIIPSRKKKSS